MSLQSWGLEHWFGRSRPQARPGRRALRRPGGQARRPAFYARLGAPDTLEGRFEVYALHLALLVLRLKREGEAGEALAQALFDHFVAGWTTACARRASATPACPKQHEDPGPGAVRPACTPMPRRSAALPDARPAESLVARTVLPEGEGDPAALAAYVAAARAALDAQDGPRLLAGEAEWPDLG